MNYSSLYDLITYIEYGTKLHIGVLFFGNYGNEKCTLPLSHTIHAGQVCDEFKKSREGFRRCFRCRTIAMQKAVSTKKTFSGYCINGIFEYTRPITIDGEVAVVLFIGNIIGNSNDKIKLRLTYKPELIDTLESGFTLERCEAVGNLLETYIRMILEAVPQNEKTSSNRLIENIKHFVDSNLEFDIKISHIANIFHYNMQYLGRLFKESTNMTFNSYVNYQRLNRSKHLLKETELTVLDISHRLGYNNISYFNRLFKKHFGTTPTEYRNTIKQ